MLLKGHKVEDQSHEFSISVSVYNQERQVAAHSKLVLTHFSIANVTHNTEGQYVKDQGRSP